MRVNTSVRLLVIASAFLSAKAALAQNSFLPAQVLVAKNTLKTQAINVDSLSSLTAETVSTNRFDRVIDEQPDRAPTDIQPLPSRNLTSAHAQGRIFNSDVANLDRNSQIISGVPSQMPSSEASVEIFVPAPRTKTIKVPTVSRLPRAANKRIPTVMAIPVVQSIRTIAPSPSKTQFTPATVANAFPAAQPIDVPQPSNNVPTVPSLPTESQAELIYPLMNPARVTSRFGWRTHPLTGNRRFHSGIDIAAPSGTPVVATATGTVISAGWNGGYGKAIVIQHNDSQQTLYGHLSEISVQPGQQIVQGSVIGLVGSTGNSTGPHLHFEARSPGANGWVAVDPTQEIQYAVDNLRRAMPYAGKDNPQGL
ncbi:M23 family metallopeptidase [Chamaesiphon sp. OTE_8_metabat_110]|uniref:M23 family metallopeptidase n=1 Tax=Chamaesiphon sp. OTE_8_metabat_110 TaxID=2964696 RepID=UPI00286C95DB|nr:M23 family metallopeptidase [Chamaesiphon sp. OTE_8_metabat_110]